MTNLIISMVMFLYTWEYVTIATTGTTSSQAFFSKTPGYRVTNNILTEILSSHSGKCVVHCLKTVTCESLSFIPDTGVCILSSSALSQPSNFSVLQEDPRSVYMEKTPALGSWKLAFRAQNGSGLNIREIWTNSSHQNDATPRTLAMVPIGCLTVTSNLPCDQIYRSRILDEWNNVEQVQIGFFANNVQVAYITFEVTNSVTNMNDFIHLDNILDSSIGSLTATSVIVDNCPVFSVTGSTRYDRLFFLCYSKQSCSGDQGWFVVLGGQGRICGWSDHSHYPVFMYTKSDDPVTWSSGEVGYAEVFAVFLKMVE